MGSEPESVLRIHEGGGDLGGWSWELQEREGIWRLTEEAAEGLRVPGVGGSAGQCESVTAVVTGRGRARPAGDGGRWGFSARRARRRLQRLEWAHCVSAGGGPGGRGRQGC